MKFTLTRFAALIVIIVGIVWIGDRVYSQYRQWEFEKAAKQESENQDLESFNSEGKTYLGSINRSQQAFYLENKRFNPSLTDLGNGVNPETEKYTYSILTADSISTQNLAIPKNDKANTYLGAVYSTGEMTLSTLCESDQPTKNMPSEIKSGFTFSVNENPKCPKGYHALN